MVLVAGVAPTAEAGNRAETIYPSSVSRETLEFRGSLPRSTPGESATPRDVSRETLRTLRGRDGLPVLKRAAQWAGVTLDHHQLALLEDLAEWLVREAIPTGGLGPSEGPVVYSRHLADSLLFASAWSSSTGAPSSLLDVGAGVGLPGLPLAIAWPHTQVTLLDKSSRRADLARRAVWMLGLDNVNVVTAQMREWTSPADFLVCRAVGSPKALRPDLARLLTSAGVAALGGSHRVRPHYRGYRVQEVPANVIGYPVWLLIMNRT